MRKEVSRAVARSRPGSGDRQDESALMGRNSIKIWKIIHISNSVIPDPESPIFSLLVKIHKYYWVKSLHPV